MTDKEKEIQKRADVKAYNFLNEMYKVLQYTDTLQLGKYAHKMGVTSYYYQILIREGIIKLDGELRSGKYTLTWEGRKPTREMALKVRQEAYEMYKAKKEAKEAKKKPVENKKKTVAVEVIRPIEPTKVITKPITKRESTKTNKSKKFSLLWGALSFEY